SPSGYEVRKNFSLADGVIYLPADTRKNAILFLETIRPEKVFFVKYEFWRHYISEIKKRNIPLYLISGIFRDNQQFFSDTPWGKWYREMLTGFTRFFVQDAASQQLLENIGIKGITISGDTRFDRVVAIANSSKNILLVDNFVNNSPVLVAGSTWKPDEEIIIEYINRNETLKCIIAPHEVSPQNINRLEQLLIKKRAVRFSRATPDTIGNYQILIVDVIGMLSSLYRYGSFAYIGGGFGMGIHNILEAATFGLPVIFGPNYRKFKEARDMVGLGAAFPVETEDEFGITADKLLNSDDMRIKASHESAAYVNRNRGATRIIIDETFISGEE
ncbi:MAG: 3-deoxy-D-manno-octulosonic acid transferase, partial [Prolixibacteraceae bacterium]|nr:3-deoxy-D-manno-octulosonic acid transferase [Prolixibacteraceae bacterium]